MKSEATLDAAKHAAKVKKALARPGRERTVLPADLNNDLGALEGKQGVIGSFRPTSGQGQTDIFSMIKWCTREKEELVDGVVDFLAQAAGVDGLT